MRSAIAVVALLALTVFGAAALNVPRHPPEAVEIQRMMHDLGHKANYDQDTNMRTPAQKESDQGYGSIERNIPGEMDYSFDLYAAVQGEYQNIFVNSLISGAVQAVCRIPNAGVTVMNLLNSQRDVLLHISARVTRQDLVLNSRTAQGSWQEEVRFEGYPFPCCGYVTVITLRVEITKSAFIISANDIELGKYPFRSELQPPVEEVELYFADSDASEKGKLITLSVDY